MHRASILLTSVLLLAGLAVAQESPAPEVHRGYSIMQTEPRHVFEPDTGFNLKFQKRELESEISFISAEMAGTGEVVTAAPYTATAVTETTQVLADGNRIVNKNSAFVARDGQGRTRREETLGRIGPLSVDSPKLIFIHDPVAHTNATLEPGKQTAIVWKMSNANVNGPIHIMTTRRLEGPEKVVVSDSNANGDPVHISDSNANGDPVHIMTTRRLEGPGKVAIEGSVEHVAVNEKNAKHEDLGTQTIEGVLAEGKRETITIPAGQIGNERAIDIVSESWYSQELHTMVLRKHSDPRSGENVYRVTDIKRGEPDASLFQVPSGYKTKAEPILELKMNQPKE
jgi:hypothetical protein